MSSTAVILIALAGLTAAGPVRPSALPPHQPEWRIVEVWRQPQGLPQNSARVVIQTRDGYLWLGTKAGISRFDGVRFTTFDDRNSGLKDNEVWDLVEMDDGTLWVGTYGGGITSLRNGVFKTYTTADGLAYDYVQTLAKDRQGGLWVGTSRGLSHWQGGRLTTPPLQELVGEANASTLHVDAQGALWIGTQTGGLHRRHHERFERDALGRRFPPSVRALASEPDGTLWIGTAGGLFRWKNGAIDQFGTEHGLGERIRRLYVDPQGNLWIGTFEGLHRYKDGVFTYYPSQDGRRDLVLALTSDREGNLWVGYVDGGLARVRRGQFVNYRDKDGLPSEHVTAVYEARDHTLWVGTASGLAVLGEGRFTPIGPDQGLPAVSIVCLLQDRAGTLWVSTEVGLHRSTAPLACENAAAPCRPRFAPVDTGVDRLYARSLLEDPTGRMWVGSDNAGLLVPDERGAFARRPGPGGRPFDAIKGLERQTDGTLWIGTRSGLIRLKNGAYRSYDERDGLSSRSIEGLYLDGSDVLWITTRAGLTRMKDGRFTSYTARQGLYTSFVHNAAGDGRGGLWLTCPMGIFRVSEGELDDLARGRRATISSVAYGTEHGLLSTTVTAGHHPAVYRTSDGRIWVVTTRGLSAVDPATAGIDAAPPAIVIEEARVGETSFDPSQPIDAGPGRGDIAIRYTALTFLAAHRTTFKYKLEGYDRDWFDAGSRRDAFYSNLPSGRYTFRVIAANADGIWNEGGAALSLSLRPHFYQTAPFYLLMASASVLAGVALHRVRTQHLRARERELEHAVQERTLALEQAHSDLERRVRERTADLSTALAEKEVLVKEIHHRVKNSLQIVSSLLSLQSERSKDSAVVDILKESRGRVLTIARVHEKLYQSGDMTRIDAHDYLHGLVVNVLTAYERVRGRVRLRVEVDPVLLELETAIPCGLIVNELVANALKHAFPDDRPGEIHVELREEADHGLRLRVADDGVGLRDAAARDRVDAGLGLELVQALVQQLEGSVDVHRHRGTAWEIRFTPLRYRPRMKSA